MTNPRVARGRQTQGMVAQRWRDNGIAPDAEPAGAYDAGKDVRPVPGLSVEVKAKNRLTILAALRQAIGNAEPGEVPIVVARHDGQGFASMDDWSVTLRLADFEEMWRVYRDAPPVY